MQCLLGLGLDSLAYVVQLLLACARAFVFIFALYELILHLRESEG